MKNRQSGFASLEIVLVTVVIAIVGSIGWYMYHTAHNASKHDAATSTTTKKTKPTIATNTTQQATTAQQLPQQTNSTTTPSSPAPTSTSPSKASTPTPTPAPAAQPSSNIVHPTLANCTRHNFTVYASVPGGTPAYNEANFSQLLYTVPYGTEITNVYCDSGDSAQMVFRCDDPNTAHYSAYHWADVSLTKPQ